MFEIAHLLTFCWMAFWAISAFRQIARGEPHSILFVIIVHFVFCGLPLLLDVVIGMPEYGAYPGFALSSQDGATILIYSVYMCAVPVLWWVLGQAQRPTQHLAEAATANRPGQASIRVQMLLIALVVSPSIALAFSPDISIYATYFQPLRSMNEEVYSHHQLIGASAKISILALGTLLFIRTPLTPSFCLVLTPWWVMDVWLDGKRNIVALSLMVVLYVLWSRGTLRGLRLASWATVFVLFLVLFSHGYQAISDRASSGSGNRIYQNVRIDYGRDDVIKMTIFAELNPDQMQILEHRGQSLLFYATAWIPRNVYPEKPYPYAQYLTSALFAASPRLWGWGMTTSCLEEAIANLGWLGLLIGPMLPLVVCRLSDSTSNVIVRLTGLPVAVLLLLVQSIAFAPLIALWFICLSMDYFKRRSVNLRLTGRRACSRADLHSQHPLIDTK